jgi:hypothetical protein
MSRLLDLSAAESGSHSGRDPEEDVTEGQAREWVHEQLIVEECDGLELAAVFTALTACAPLSCERRHEMFRRCGELVLLSAPPVRVAVDRPTVSRVRPSGAGRSFGS